MINGILGNFHKATREISFDVTTDSITIKNHIDNEDIDHETIRTNYTLRIDEFDTFSIKQNCSIAFTYADFRAMCHFAEASEAFVRISFEAPGEPLCMSCRDQDAFVANLLVATMLHDLEDTGQDPLKSTSDKTKSQLTNNEDTDPNTDASVPKPKAPPVKRKRRVINTQSDDNPFNFMNANPVEPIFVPEAARNRESAVSDLPSVPPSIVPCTQSTGSSVSASHISETDPHKLILLNRPSSLIPCPPLEDLQLNDPQKQSEVDPQKQSEDIFFETEESEPNKDAEDIIQEPVEDDSVPGSPPPPNSQLLRRRRYIFARFYNSKPFDKYSIPGANEILAPDSQPNSDDEGN